MGSFLCTSLFQLAEAADVSNTYIANIECGQTWVSDKTNLTIMSKLSFLKLSSIL